MKKEQNDKQQEEKLQELRYPPGEDIYSQEVKEPFNEEGEQDDRPSGESGLDVPGSELDDAGEGIGEEDEENNYYSLGGDDHNDLEEDPG